MTTIVNRIRTDDREQSDRDEITVTDPFGDQAQINVLPNGLHIIFGGQSVAVYDQDMATLLESLVDGLDPSLLKDAGLWTQEQVEEWAR